MSDEMKLPLYDETEQEQKPEQFLEETAEKSEKSILGFKRNVFFRPSRRVEMVVGKKYSCYFNIGIRFLFYQ